MNFEPPPTLRDVLYFARLWVFVMAGLAGLAAVAFLVAAALKHIGLWGEAANGAAILATLTAAVWLGTKFLR